VFHVEGLGYCLSGIISKDKAESESIWASGEKSLRNNLMSKA
jgi:hypothetical protein